MNERDGPLLDTLMKNNMLPSGECSIEHPLGGVVGRAGLVTSRLAIGQVRRFSSTFR